MPVDDGETSNTAQLQVHPSRGGEEDVAGDDSDAARLSAIRDSEERTKKELAAMEKKIDALTEMIQKLLDDKEQS